MCVRRSRAIPCRASSSTAPRELQSYTSTRPENARSTASTARDLRPSTSATSVTCSPRTPLTNAASGAMNRVSIRPIIVALNPYALTTCGLRRCSVAARRAYARPEPAFPSESTQTPASAKRLAIGPGRSRVTTSQTTRLRSMRSDNVATICSVPPGASQVSTWSTRTGDLSGAPSIADPAVVGDHLHVHEPGTLEHGPDLVRRVAVLERRGEPVELVVDAHAQRIVRVRLERERLREAAEPRATPEEAVREDDAAEEHRRQRIAERVQDAVRQAHGDPPDGRDAAQDGAMPRDRRLPVQIDVHAAAGPREGHDRAQRGL